MTLAVDLDGVVHWYRRGWHDGTIYDEPMPGAIQGLATLMQYTSVFIHTTRPALQVVPWLQGHGLDATADDTCAPCAVTGPLADCPLCEGSGLLHFWDERGKLLVTNRKLPAVAYLDDRAVRFTDWDSALLVLGQTLGRALRPEPAP